MPIEVAKERKVNSQTAGTGTSTGDNCTDNVNLLWRSSYASVLSKNGSFNKVYYQGVEGCLYETMYPRGSGWGSVKILAQGIAAQFTPLAAIMWGPNQQYIRLYYLSPSFQLRELCCNDGTNWVDGALNAQRVQAAPFSNVSALVFMNGNDPQLRVYYQRADYKIQEHCWGNSGWSNGATLPGDPLPATALAFVNRNPIEQSTPSIRGYFQERSGGLREQCWDSGWNIGDFFVRQAAFRTSIAATVSPFNNFPRIHVYYASARDTIIEWINDHGWNGPKEISQVAIVPGAKITACSFPREAQKVDVRLYTTIYYNIIHEFIYRQNVWEKGGMVDVGGNKISIDTVGV